jgi:hypothetical protein
MMTPDLWHSILGAIPATLIALAALVTSLRHISKCSSDSATIAAAAKAAAVAAEAAARAAAAVLEAARVAAAKC